jgi:hypothetical protein
VGDPPIQYCVIKQGQSGLEDLRKREFISTIGWGVETRFFTSDRQHLQSPRIPGDLVGLCWWCRGREDDLSNMYILLCEWIA